MSWSFLLTLIFLLIWWKTDKVHCRTTPSDIACKDGWISFESYCYMVRGEQRSEKLSWSKASDFCKGLGADLVSIHSKEETEFLTHSILRRTQTTTWIGLHDLNNETTHEWSDGSAVDYVNWRPGEPSGSKHGDEDCVEILYSSNNVHRHGKWNDANCLDNNAYICKITLATTNGEKNPHLSGENGGRHGHTHSKHKPSHMSVETPICEDDWLPIENYCYYVESYATVDRLSWFEASDFCTKSGGHLASIHSKLENDIITDTLLPMTKSFTWIGLHDQGNENNFEWSDGSPVDFVNWRRGEPSGLKHGDEDCVGIFHDNGKWNDGTCSDRRPYICQKRRITTSETENEYLHGQKTVGNGNASVTTIVIVVSCIVVLVISAASFIYLKRDCLADKGQKLSGVIFKSPESCKIDKNRSSDKMKLLDK